MLPKTLTVEAGKECLGVDLVEFMHEWGHPLKFKSPDNYGTSFDKNQPAFVARYSEALVFFDENGKVRYVRSLQKTDTKHDTEK